MFLQDLHCVQVKAGGDAIKEFNDGDFCAKSGIHWPNSRPMTPPPMMTISFGTLLRLWHDPR